MTWSPEPEGGAQGAAVPGPVGMATVTSAVVIVLALMASPVLDACRGAAQSLLAP